MNAPVKYTRRKNLTPACVSSIRNTPTVRRDTAAAIYSLQAPFSLIHKSAKGRGHRG